MIYKIILLPTAKADIIQVVKYYKQISIPLAEQFLIRLREAKDYLREIPEGFQVRYLHVRTLLLKQFPYHIHYLIESKRRRVVILAIIHAYRNPQDYPIQ